MNNQWRNRVKWFRRYMRLTRKLVRQIDGLQMQLEAARKACDANETLIKQYRAILKGSSVGVFDEHRIDHGTEAQQPKVPSGLRRA